jgi:hypothetical protein
MVFFSRKVGEGQENLTPVPIPLFGGGIREITEKAKASSNFTHR